MSEKTYIVSVRHARSSSGGGSTYNHRVTAPTADIACQIALGQSRRANPNDSVFDVVKVVEN